MDDIAPELLEKIQKEFEKQFSNDKTIADILKKAKDSSITYAEANDFSIRVGEILSNAYNKFITEEILPEGRMWYNIAQRIMQPTLENNYDLITGVCEYAQKSVNAAGGIGMKYVKPALNQDKIDGFIDKLSNSEHYEEVQWMLNEPVVNFSQAVVDDSIKVNADFHAKSGLSPKIVRKLDNAETRTVVRGKSKIRYKVPCKWCQSLAGTWDYFDMPDYVADNIFRRHENCRCTVEYVSAGKRQDVWSKQYREDVQEEVEKRENKASQQLKVNKNQQSNLNEKNTINSLKKQHPTWSNEEATVYYRTELDRDFLLNHKNVPAIELESIKGIQKFTIDEVQTIADQTKIIADTYIPKIESKWSGIIRIGERFYKDWNCDIVSKSETHPFIILHEQLHAKSASYHSEIVYTMFKSYEEGAVQLMAEEIAKKTNMQIIQSYIDEVYILDEIRILTGKYSAYEFAETLFSVNLPDRKQWLTDLIDGTLDLTDKQKKEALRLLERLD